VSLYYYLVATLPALQFGAPAPMTSAEFLERCRSQLTEKDMLAIAAARLVSEPDSPPPECSASEMLPRYYAWERSLRNELARARGRKLGREAEKWIRDADWDDEAMRSAQALLQAESPLEGEIALERERWARVDALRGLHAFDLEVVAAYRIQLQCLERLAGLGAEAGEERYRETYAAILATATTSEESGVTP
jgi:hypothetical protein